MKASELAPNLRVPVITKYVPEVLDRIGNTPLLKMRNITKGLAKKVEVYAKAEWVNPGGSVKARPALRMVRDGMKAGKLGRGKELIDSTSGNTGIAYALIGKILGFKVNLVLPANVCKLRKGMMASQYSANLILSDPIESSDGAIRLCRKIYSENPDKYFLPDQYNNPSNWAAHKETTAREIWEQTNGTVTHFLAGIGTSGTLMGTTRGLKAMNRNILSYAVEPAEPLHGIEGLKHMETSIIPGIYEPSVFDEKLSVKTDEAYKMVSRLEEEEGLLVGTSSGAAMVGAMRVAERLDEGVVVTIFPDSCEECIVAHGEF
ncbi:MAG: cysteine synthase family protein [Nitrospinae bacterium]|nr:cysteine synthase family protein [Nitrospinota bacterium]